ncbi:MAG: toxin-antitoxin system HicB family antitoxin [Gloeotrichia echinulata GP01]
MTLTLNLPPELEQYLALEAKQQGVSVETYTLQILQQYILPKDKQTKLVNVLQSWMDEDDDQEQHQTGEYLIDALDQNRLSDRKLFPVELKGVTW